MSDLPLTMPDGKPLPLAFQFSTIELITEQKREIGMRHEVYAKRVADGKMSQADMDRKIAMASAILNLLEQLDLGQSYSVQVNDQQRGK